MNKRFLGKVIRHTRTTAGLTGRQFAERVGIAQPHVSNLERGLVSVSEDTMIKIADAFGTTVPDMIDAWKKSTSDAPETVDG